MGEPRPRSGTGASSSRAGSITIRPLPETILDATKEALDALRMFRDHRPNPLFDNDVWGARQLADFSVWAYSSGAIETLSPYDQLDTMFQRSDWHRVDIQTRLGRAHQQVMIGLIASATACAERLQHLNHAITGRTKQADPGTTTTDITHNERSLARSYKASIELIIRALQGYTKSAQPNVLRPEPLLLLDESYQPSRATTEQPPSDLSESLALLDPQVPVDHRLPSGEKATDCLEDSSDIESDLARVGASIRMFYFRRDRINAARKNFVDSKRFDDFKGSYYFPIQAPSGDQDVIGTREGEKLSDELWRNLMLFDGMVEDWNAGEEQDITAQFQAKIRLSVNRLRIETPTRKHLFNQRVQSRSQLARHEASGFDNSDVIAKQLAANPPLAAQHSSPSYSWPHFFSNISPVKSKQKVAQWFRKVPQKIQHHRDSCQGSQTLKGKEEPPLAPRRDVGLAELESDSEDKIHRPHLRPKASDEHC